MVNPNIRKAAQKILDSWGYWDGEAQQVAHVQQDPRYYEQGMLDNIEDVLCDMANKIHEETKAKMKEHGIGR